MSPANNKLSPYDWIIVGGGLVGASIAYGLIQKQPQLRILVLDGSDTDYRASVGNFGLIWVQGKGNDFPAYANWSLQGADLWPEFARQLSHKSQIDIAYQRQGGLEFALSQHQLSTLSEEMAAIADHTQGAFHYNVLNREAALALQPGLGEAVVGAIYSPQDGQVNPLYLLLALQKASQLCGVDYQSSCRVDTIEVLEHGFNAAGSLAKHIVLCAGLDNQRLGKQLAMHLPVTPVKGQILITERVGHAQLRFSPTTPNCRRHDSGRWLIRTYGFR